MERHFMAVCVVCILYAKHIPCEEHFDTLATKTAAATIGKTLENNYFEITNNNAAFNENTLKEKSIHNNDDTFSIDLQYSKRKSRTKSSMMITDELINNRNRRHSNENHENINNDDDFMMNGRKIANEFLKKLFQQYGNADGKTMNVDGFEIMLKRLGLYNLIEEKTKQEIGNDNGENSKHNSLTSQQLSSSLSGITNNLNESCISSLQLISRTTSNKQQQLLKQMLHNHNNNENDRKSSNYNLKGTDLNNNNNTADGTDNEHNHHNSHHSNSIDRSFVSLDSKDLFSICPILLYQLVAPTSLERSGCINISLIPENMRYSSSIDDDPEHQDRLLVWVYAISSVLGVSLVGLLGVAVIPCMDRQIYQNIIQFLVALAVGTLAGDALLHLLPHAMMTFSSQGHESMTWKGLVAVLGIIFFFATERVLTMIAEWRKKIEKKEKPSSRVRVMRDPDSASINNSIAGDKLCKHKYSSYPYCYDEIAMDTKDDHHHHHQDTTIANNISNNQQKLSGGQQSTTEKVITPISGNGSNSNCNKNNIRAYHRNNVNDHDADGNETAQSLLPHNYSTISDSFSAINKEDGNNPDNNTISTNLDDTTSIEGMVVKDKPPLVKEETFTIILREHESSHHGHSHKHGHVHSPPRTLSAVAWMVIMGDGLHNFTDGMAIGAAFSNNIAGGFSTAIAVFCHELPHELGDFAVLLKAGMSAKQAVYYNLLSSVLSFFGMILGVFFGDTKEASAWIFACAAGMFIYIALVDMMPELTSTHNERCALSQCLLQIFGMCCGLGVMLIIALYEHDLKNIFSTTSNSHNDHYHDNEGQNHFH